jgi:hypothetical protein
VLYNHTFSEALVKVDHPTEVVLGDVSLGVLGREEQREYVLAQQRGDRGPWDLSTLVASERHPAERARRQLDKEYLVQEKQLDEVAEKTWWDSAIATFKELFKV